mmetsp:Transcript_6828/g.10128  ORF Transcript_6828/g.10128 Transcript_6828/m.10128 type:complete len:203 (-) Transcript_6828:153-761(-)
MSSLGQSQKRMQLDHLQVSMHHRIRWHYYLRPANAMPSNLGSHEQQQQIDLDLHLSCAVESRLEVSKLADFELQFGCTAVHDLFPFDEDGGWSHEVALSRAQGQGLYASKLKLMLMIRDEDAFAFDQFLGLSSPKRHEQQVLQCQYEAGHLRLHHLNWNSCAESSTNHLSCHAESGNVQSILPWHPVTHFELYGIDTYSKVV